MNAPNIQNLNDMIGSAFAETLAWYEAQPEENFNKHMMEGKWTMAGHLYHLIKSTKGVSKGLSMPRLALRTAFGKCNRTERTFDEQYQKYIQSLNDFEEKNGTPATPASDFVPAEGREFEKASLLKRFKEEGENYQKALSSWKEDNLNVYVLPHPIMGKLTLREFTYFTSFHATHHLNILKANYEE